MISNWCFFVLSFAGCTMWGLSEEHGAQRVVGMFLAFEGAMFFIITEIRDKLCCRGK